MIFYTNTQVEFLKEFPQKASFIKITVISRGIMFFLRIAKWVFLRNFCLKCNPVLFPLNPQLRLESFSASIELHITRKVLNSIDETQIIHLLNSATTSFCLKNLISWEINPNPKLIGKPNSCCRDLNPNGQHLALKLDGLTHTQSLKNESI